MTRPLDVAVLAAGENARDRLGEALAGLGPVRGVARVEELRSLPAPDAVVVQVPAVGDSPVAALRADPELGLVPVIAVCEGEVAAAVEEGADDALSEACVTHLPEKVRARVALHRRREERLQAEAACRVEAEAASRAKDDLLAAAAHDLRTPLGSILLWAELLRQEQPDSETTERALGVIERGARCLARVVDEISDAARALAGPPAPELAPLDLAAVVEAAVASVEDAAEARAVQVQVAVDRAVGPVLGDEARLRQALARVLSAAVGRAPAGGLVEVSLGLAGAEALLRVHATGSGAEAAPPGAEAARRANPPCKGGTLGLVVLRHLVEAVGGILDAEVPGGGLSVTLHLRRALPAGVCGPEPRGSAVPDGLRGVRVLVVEDDADARAGLEALLRRWGADVEAVGSVPEALRALAGGSPDILLSDLAMPGEDGLCLVRRLRELEAGRAGRLPAVALTARAGPQDRAEALRAGFDDHLAKPLDPQRLQGVLLGLLARRPPAPR